MGDLMGMERGRATIVLAALFVFGVLYNAFVEWLERDDRDRGFTSLLVVGGVIVTLGGAAMLVGWELILVLALCFTASGTPMIIGSLARYARERAEAEKFCRSSVEELLRGDDGDGS